MPMHKFLCQACYKEISIPEKAIGGKYSCPYCHASVIVPTSEEDTAFRIGLDRSNQCVTEDNPTAEIRHTLTNIHATENKQQKSEKAITPANPGASAKYVRTMAGLILGTGTALFCISLVITLAAIYHGKNVTAGVSIVTGLVTLAISAWSAALLFLAVGVAKNLYCIAVKQDEIIQKPCPLVGKSQS